MELSLIYVTAKDRQDCLAIARKLIEERLIACANISGSMTSVYRWEGKIETADEVSMLLKTRPSLVERVTHRLKELHAYECPCVIAINSGQGNADFFQWVNDETVNDAGLGEAKCETA